MGEAVLVTGAFGLVGSATVKRLAADGHECDHDDKDRGNNREDDDHVTNSGWRAGL